MLLHSLREPLPILRTVTHAIGSTVECHHEFFSFAPFGASRCVLARNECFKNIFSIGGIWLTVRLKTSADGRMMACSSFASLACWSSLLWERVFCCCCGVSRVALCCSVTLRRGHLFFSVQEPWHEDGSQPHVAWRTNFGWRLAAQETVIGRATCDGSPAGSRVSNCVLRDPARRTDRLKKQEHATSAAAGLSRHGRSKVMGDLGCRRGDPKACQKTVCFKSLCLQGQQSEAATAIFSTRALWHWKNDSNQRCLRCERPNTSCVVKSKTQP